MLVFVFPGIIDQTKSNSLIWGGNVLPVVEITVCLGRLSAEVGQVASEEEVVGGCDSE